MVSHEDRTDKRLTLEADHDDDDDVDDDDGRMACTYAHFENR